MITLPLLIGFGLLAALLIADRNHHSDRGVVVWLIILLMVALIGWGSIMWGIRVLEERIYQ